MTPRLRFLFPLSVLPLLLSCGTPPAEEEATDTLVTSQALAIVDGTPGATGVLAVLNDRSTTVATLDYEAHVETRAAHNLIAWRAGPDGVENTADDRRFLTLAQVDAVPYVGPGAISDIEVFARATGRVEVPLDAFVGRFDTVDFNLAEARRALKAANTESATTLQNVYGISALNVQNLVAARPIANMVRLERINTVDADAIQRLKNGTRLAPEGDPCTGASTCQAGLSCVGIPGDNTNPYGRCRNTSVYLPGEGDSCNALTPCQQGLVCNGLASGSDQGLCRPAWMAGSFSQYADVRLPPSATVVESWNFVVGLATVPEDIIVEVDIAHASPEKLVLTLVDPGGDTALLWDGPNEGYPPARIPVTRGISRDASVNGRWKLLVSNPSGTGSGTLRSWTLRLTSRWD